MMFVGATGCSAGCGRRSVDRTFRIGQLVSAAAYSIGHGGNDAQKTIGVIWAVMIAGGMLDAERATARRTGSSIASYSAMAFGTAIGGWRIVKTMGMGLTHLKPVGGFCAEVAGAITLFTATALKIPVSTTHTITGAIIGVGSVTKARGIRWAVATRIVWAWIFTIPAAGDGRRRSRWSSPRRSARCDRAPRRAIPPGVSERWDVVIVGGGHNGLVAAGLLARRGRRVCVVERRHEGRRRGRSPRPRGARTSR